MLTLGIDDAGRGPLIGPMILAGVVVDKDQEKIIKQSGATDSKLLYHPTRVKLFEIIRKNSHSHKIVKTSAQEIDEALNSPDNNLNKLEAQKMAEIINALNPKKKPLRVIVDCPSVNTAAWKNILLKFIKHSSNLTLRCEHKADVKYTVVAAASILAKVSREEAVDSLKKDYGDFGSGYPSDPKTKEFLKDKGLKFANSGIFRKTWRTWKKMFPEEAKDKKQKTLGEF